MNTAAPMTDEVLALEIKLDDLREISVQARQALVQQIHLRERAESERDELAARLDHVSDAARAVSQATFSHIDGRDLLKELHPRRWINITRRVDGVETSFEGDWLSGVWEARKKLDAALSTTPATLGRTPGTAEVCNLCNGRVFSEGYCSYSTNAERKFPRGCPAITRPATAGEGT